jgi:5,5'-dehydrodivanillate O-demethylase oxygenase subunit
MGRYGKLDFADLEPVGPGTPSGRYLRLFWQPVMRGKDLPAGRAKPIEILGERFTLYRGESGTPHLTGFRCAHRGTQLSLGWVEGETIRCRYHGWRFGADGQCVEQPNEDRPFCDRVTIPSYPTREYAGFVFAWLGEGAPPPFPTYPDLDRPGVLVADPVEILPCTFWNRFDNDHGHRHWVHRATALRRNRPDVLVLHHEAAEETPYGWVGIRSVKGKGADAETSLGEILPGARDAHERHMGLAKLTHWFMPNARMLFQRTRAKGFEGSELWDTKIVWTVPINDRAHAAFDVTHTPLLGKEAEEYEQSRREQQEREAEIRWDLAEKVMAGEMRLEDLPDDMGGYTSFTIEDYTTQVGQGGIAERGPELLAPSDEGPLFQRNLWLREVNRLVEGKPLTEWRLPAEPFARMEPR